jgi:hypothetical protein
MIVKYMGIRSGKETSDPVYYQKIGDEFQILIEKKKELWSSLRDGSLVNVTIKGDEKRAWAEAVNGEKDSISGIRGFLNKFPEIKLELNISPDEKGEIREDSIRSILKNFGILRLKMQS